MTIIPRKKMTREQRLRNERIAAFHDDNKLYWEITGALTYANLIRLQGWFWRNEHPACHDHDMRCCPICTKPHKELLSDYLQEGLQ